MDYQSLHQLFCSKVYPSEPNEWDIEDALSDLEALSEENQHLLLQAIPTIWPISHSLAFSFLKDGARLTRDFDTPLLAEWLRRILHHYEVGGLKEARAYMSSPDKSLVDGETESYTVVLENHLSRLHTYARGVSGLDIHIQESPSIYTDTTTLFLPQKVTFFESYDDNLLFYKLTICLLSCCILQGSFGRHRFVTRNDRNKHVTPHQVSALDYFSQFGNPRLAQDIYQCIELYRVFNLLALEYPGLFHETESIRRKLLHHHSKHQQSSNTLLESFYSMAVLPEERADNLDHPVVGLLEKHSHDIADPKVHHKIYEYYGELAEDVGPLCFLPFMDSFDFAEAERVREERVEENAKKFSTALANLINSSEITFSEQTPTEVSVEQADSTRLQIIEEREGKSAQSRKRTSLQINNTEIEIPAELQELINRIHADLGSVPEGYVSAAFGMSGGGMAVGEGAANGDEETVSEFIPYDEWDYRRHGYRKNWCSLRERPLKGLVSDFYRKTLVKHRGTLLKIRRQFEMINTREHFARRRRHGDDLDLDALIDSLGDQQAGLAPSEKLFVRLIRNERSISTLFLVDMSNSTEGWIGTAIKEALVLMCEAMEIVGDKYGIYGFSGMRRMRSEVYKIKDLNEHYSIEVKQRLAAIAPKEYTRMGPPIRHMIKQFKGVDTKTRLLVMLSDGKPEDYDDYKGQYAIEDTRKALAEARGSGIHPYCITIDREAHEYLEHLFGRGHYTYVKNVEQLPSRLTDIYRLLTR
jgi:nitric oxide reductase NorD protein